MTIFFHLPFFQTDPYSETPTRSLEQRSCADAAAGAWCFQMAGILRERRHQVPRCVAESAMVLGVL
jgi:hypothetical protein